MHIIMKCIVVSGTTTLQGNVDCGGGLALTGSNAFFNIGAIDPGNYSNTYLTLKANTANNDWC